MDDEGKPVVFEIVKYNKYRSIHTGNKNHMPALLINNLPA